MTGATLGAIPAAKGRVSMICASPAEDRPMWNRKIRLGPASSIPFHFSTARLWVVLAAAGAGIVFWACDNGGKPFVGPDLVMTQEAPAPTLNRASTYGILAGSTVTCAGAPGTVNADVGVSPGSTTTGFPPCVITGVTNLANPAAAGAQLDLTTAYDYLAARPCDTVVTPADLGGTTLAPGVYCIAASLGVTGTVTLNGPADGVWVFQIGSTLTTGTNAIIALSGGAQAKNVWWQVGSSATLGTGTTFRGNILALTSITLVDNATMLGRALARNGAVTLGTNNSITLP